MTRSAVIFAALVATAPDSADARDLRRSAVVEAVAKTSPAVVSVRVRRMVASRQNPLDWFFRDINPRQHQETASQGSGVIISPNGYVLTNYHVISVGGDVEIELTDGRGLTAEVVGSAPDHDLAVLQIESSESLPYVPMGRSDDLLIGETVIAIGNPFGLAHTVTTGIVSAVDRTINAGERTYFDFIQTDASINPGNSGGALLNIEGSLIGVNTAIYGRAQGIGFAIPIDKAKRIVNDLLRYAEVRRPFFGFDTQRLTRELAESFGVRPDRGVVVSSVERGSPASRALKPGDIIESVGKHRVTDPDALRFRLGDYTVGQSASLRIRRGGAVKTVRIEASALTPSEALERATDKTGLRFRVLLGAEASRARLPEGAVVVESVTPGSIATRYRLRPGDWIRAVSSKRVLGKDQLASAVAESYWRGELLLLIQRGRAWQQLAFPF